ncbi:MAG: hypothetical protein IJZ33_07390 [Clostridia bacterium]|nr:hypothetical protein [Clostridia bacterium]
MAVATDSHRDSLIPEYTVRQYTRKRTESLQDPRPDALRLFFCASTIAQIVGFFNRFFEKNQTDFRALTRQRQTSKAASMP